MGSGSAVGNTTTGRGVSVTKTTIGSSKVGRTIVVGAGVTVGVAVEWVIVTYSGDTGPRTIAVVEVRSVCE